MIFGLHSDPAAALVLLRQKLGAADRLSLEADGSLRLIIAHRLKPVGGRSWASLPTGEVFAPTARADASLNKALKSAHKRLNAVDAGTLFGVGRSITAKGPANPHLRLILPLAFLAPDIQDLILDGRAPSHLSVSRITQNELPLAWADQRKALGVGR